jgi:hypothetical protein
VSYSEFYHKISHKAIKNAVLCGIALTKFSLSNKIEYIVRNESEKPVLTRVDRLEKICKQFPLLSEEKQDHILGILQALVFANTAGIPRNTKLRKSKEVQ